MISIFFIFCHLRLSRTGIVVKLLLIIFACLFGFLVLVYCDRLFWTKSNQVLQMTTFWVRFLLFSIKMYKFNICSKIDQLDRFIFKFHFIIAVPLNFLLLNSWIVSLQFNTKWVCKFFAHNARSLRSDISTPLLCTLQTVCTQCSEISKSLSNLFEIDYFQFFMPGTSIM